MLNMLIEVKSDTLWEVFCTVEISLIREKLAMLDGLGLAVGKPVAEEYGEVDSRIIRVIVKGECNADKVNEKIFHSQGGKVIHLG